MLRILNMVVLTLGLLILGATLEDLATPPARQDCYAFIGRDGSERVFLLNKCEGNVRILGMPEAPPPALVPEHKSRI
jgi:hypothetical protein